MSETVSEERNDENEETSLDNGEIFVDKSGTNYITEEPVDEGGSTLSSDSFMLEEHRRARMSALRKYYPSNKMEKDHQEKAMRSAFEARSGLVPFLAVSSCLACDKPFHIGTMKNHCHGCGHVFCSHCLNKGIKIIGVKKKCKACVNCSDPNNFISSVNNGWVPNCESCQLCNAKFTTIRRRHHCRSCGVVMCRKCSRRSVVPGYELEMRTCKECYKYRTRTSMKEKQFTL